MVGLVVASDFRVHRNSEWCDWCAATFETRMSEADARYAANMADPHAARCPKCTFDFMEPVAHCELEKRDGIHDGPKWTCGAGLLEPPCLVYSFGSAGRYDFEQSIRKERGGAQCEMHIFDCNPKWEGQGPNALRLVNATYHTYGISGSTRRGVMKNGATVQFMSLNDIMDALGHTGRKIDILKMDVEGAEYAAMRGPFEDMAEGKTGSRRVPGRGTQPEPRGADAIRGRCGQCGVAHVPQGAQQLGGMYRRDGVCICV